MGQKCWTNSDTKTVRYVAQISDSLENHYPSGILNIYQKSLLALKYFISIVRNWAILLSLRCTTWLVIKSFASISVTECNVVVSVLRYFLFWIPWSIGCCFARKRGAVVTSQKMNFCFTEYGKPNNDLHRLLSSSSSNLWVCLVCMEEKKGTLQVWRCKV